MSSCQSSDWPKIARNPYHTTQTTTVLTTQKMVRHPWIHRGCQSRRAADYHASSPPNDCFWAPRPRAVPRHTSPSQFPKEDPWLIRTSILQQLPSPLPITSMPNLLGVDHSHRIPQAKRIYHHLHHRTLTPANPHYPTEHTESSKQQAQHETYTHMPKIPRIIHPPQLSSPSQIAAIPPRLLWPTGPAVLRIRSHEMILPPQEAVLATLLAWRSLSLSVLVWRIRVKRSYLPRSRSTISKRIGRTMRCTSFTGIKSVA